MNVDPAVIEALRPLLWGLAYRMTGTVQDADDIAQEALIRAWRQPPADQERPLRPWLVSVTMNLARDVLRARRRRAYIGPWLPAPVADSRLLDDALGDGDHARYAWLVAAERLTPTQRAVVLCREVLDLSAAETAVTLRCTPHAVDAALSRARAALGQPARSPSLVDDGLLTAFLTLLRLGLPGPAARLLHPEAVALTDGGGAVNAARMPVIGAAKVVQFFRRINRLYPPNVRVRLERCNGLLTVIGELPPTGPARDGRLPNAFTLAARVDANRIVGFWSVVAPAKLAGVCGHEGARV